MDTLLGLKNPPHAKYRLTAGNKIIELEALTCLVLNSGSAGGIHLQGTNKVSIIDGLLEVFTGKKDLSSATALASYLLKIGNSQIWVYHWKEKENHVAADPSQTTWIDGELPGPAPYTISTIPQGVSIVVPG